MRVGFSEVLEALQGGSGASSLSLGISLDRYLQAVFLGWELSGTAKKCPSSCCCWSLEIPNPCSWHCGALEVCTGALGRDVCKSGESELSLEFFGLPSWSVL